MQLSTIANADRIAFIADGKVLEYGSPSELLQKKHGRYRRLVESQKRGATLEALLAKTKGDKEEGEEEEEVEKQEEEEEEKKAFSAKRARELASPDLSYMLLGKRNCTVHHVGIAQPLADFSSYLSLYLCTGSIGAIMAGGVFPVSARCSYQ